MTLTEVLEARGSPLEEDEVWCLLLATTDALLDISKKGEFLLLLTKNLQIVPARGRFKTIFSVFNLFLFYFFYCDGKI